jgi:hypothetical protein
MAPGKMASTMLLALVAAMPGLAAQAAERDVVTFSASVKVDVDATGKPVKVEAPGDLPAEIRGYIEKRVASWQYQPARLEGVPQASTTYVSVNACAMPVAEGYRLGVDFDGNGPRRAGDRTLAPPVYPIQAMIGGTEADFTLILAVDDQGKARIEEVERADISGRAGRATFRPELERWVKTIRFDPEIVAGKPVPSRIRMSVDFTLRDSRPPQGLRAELQAKAAASRECQLASSDGDATKPIALEPAVTVIPRPAG